MDNRAYWVWLQHGFGEGSPMPWRIYQKWPGGVEGFFKDGPRAWNSAPGVTERQAAALFSFSLEEAQAQLAYAEVVGWKVLTPECEKYPEALRNIFDPPAVLYAKGTLPDVDRCPAIAVVGARKAQKASEDKGKEFGYQLAIGGAVVVTGGAVGIDAAVTMGALSGEGPVVCVLPVSLNSAYPSKNTFLRSRVLERGGALLTEYFSQQTPGYGTFPVRNRLITGLSCGVLLVQAAQKSGTMLYAAHAKDQNRDVFVWPGVPGDPAFAGGQSLIQDGAIPVERGEEVLEEYAHRFRQRGPGGEISPFDGPRLPWEDQPEDQPDMALADSSQEDLSPELREALAALAEEPRHLSQLEERSGIPGRALLSALTALELRGLASSLPGNCFRRGGARPQAAAAQQEAPAALSAQEDAVLAALTGSPQSLSQLEERTGLPAGRLSSLLTGLELRGLAASCPGGRYRRG